MNMQAEILSKPISELSVEDLKTGIRNKFKTIAKFCRLTGRGVYEFGQLLRAKETPAKTAELEKVLNDARSFELGTTKGEITEEHRKQIKAAIFSQYDNALDFCEKNPEFINTWLSNVMNGGVIKITNKVKALAKALNIELK
jgi:hypothetical protein